MAVDTARPKSRLHSLHARLDLQSGVDYKLVPFLFLAMKHSINGDAYPEIHEAAETLNGSIETGDQETVRKALRALQYLIRNIPMSVDLGTIDDLLARASRIVDAPEEQRHSPLPKIPPHRRGDNLSGQEVTIYYK